MTLFNVTIQLQPEQNVLVSSHVCVNECFVQDEDVFFREEYFVTIIPITYFYTPSNHVFINMKLNFTRLAFYEEAPRTSNINTYKINNEKGKKEEK